VSTGPPISVAQSTRKPGRRILCRLTHRSGGSVDKEAGPVQALSRRPESRRSGSRRSHGTRT
jgi:hypothetical protein